MICQSMVNILEEMSAVIQLMPSSSLSPVTALHAVICQWWVLMLSRSSACHTTDRINIKFGSTYCRKVAVSMHVLCKQMEFAIAHFFDLFWRHCSREVLLVGEDKESGSS